LRRKPLNLNRATRDELIQLPGMNELLVTNLLVYRKDNGNLTSIYELQAVPGFTVALIEPILPFVTVSTTEATDISPGAKHPSGPSFKEIWQGLTGEFIQRFVWIPEEQRGYTDPDTTFREIQDDEGSVVGMDTSLSSRYAGSPIQSYSRLRLRYRQHVSIALTGEKDRGEQFAWDPENRLYGYDFLSGHVALKDFGHLKSLVIGDYNLQVGQGLVLSRGLGFGKGADVIRTVKQASRGILPYASVNENQYLRGAAATVAFGDWYFTAFGSRTRLDASVRDRDTVSEEVTLVGSIQLSGLHRTPNEIANRKSTAETAFGGRVEYQADRLRVGMTHYQQLYDNPIDRPENAFNQFDFRGDYNHLSSVDVDYVLQNVNFFGEVARSRSGGIAATAGLMSSLSRKVDLALLVRSFDKDFHTSKAFVFAERPTNVRNEQGLYMGLQIKPNPRWLISAYFDQFYFPVNSFRRGFSARGYEYLAQVEFKPKRGTQLYMRFRSDNQERNATDYPLGQQLAYLIPTQRLQWRTHFQKTIDRNLLVRTRMEFSWWTQGEEEFERGFLLYQDFSYKMGFKFKVTGRYAIFDVRDFDARIFAYENDVLGFFTIPPYNGVGSRYYVILNYKPIRGIEFWLRFAQTRLQDVRTFGSGLDEIQGDTRSEVKLQMRIQW
ncbi:MAG: helix-hairpin-helix domain-containing protein, partial [Bacteroidota bacterium]